MITTARLTAFAATTDLDRAVAFYVDTLGLTLVHRDEFADPDGNTLSFSQHPLS